MLAGIIMGLLEEFGGDPAIITKDDGSHHHVLQFSYVARPRPIVEYFKGLWGDTRETFMMLQRKSLTEKERQLIDILFAFS